MNILCRHRSPVLVARRGQNELRHGFVLSVMCSRCRKDLRTDDYEGLPVLISYDEFMNNLLKHPDRSWARRASKWNVYL